MGVVETKTATISALQHAVDDATKIQANAQATVNAFTDKSNMFSELLTEAQNSRNVAENNFEMATKTGQASMALENSSILSSTNAVETNKKAKKMLVQCQEVIDKLLDAALETSNFSRFLTARKSSNPYISNEMVTVAATAETDAAAAVSAAIAALTSTATALSFSQKALQTTELTQVESTRFNFLVNGVINANTTATPSPKSILVVLGDGLTDAKAKEVAAQKASDSVNARLAIAEAELDYATTDLQVKQQALAAAKAAMAGG